MKHHVVLRGMLAFMGLAAVGLCVGVYVSLSNEIVRDAAAEFTTKLAPAVGALQQVIQVRQMALQGTVDAIAVHDGLPSRGALQQVHMYGPLRMPLTSNQKLYHSHRSCDRTVAVDSVRAWPALHALFIDLR